MSWSEVVKVAAIAVAILAVLAALYAFIAKKTGAPAHRGMRASGYAITTPRLREPAAAVAYTLPRLDGSWRSGIEPARKAAQGWQI
jgi:hypothetical protein